MKDQKIFMIPICLLMSMVSYQNVDAQEALAQEAYAIFEQSCLICHGEHGSYKEALIIEHTALTENGSVVPGNPDASVFYQRLIETNVAKRMPLGQPPLAAEAIETIRQWIASGAQDWDTIPKPKPGFITTDAILDTIENHISSLSQRDRTFARYFTLTHLYNAGETTEALNAYRRALSKLINSLSWGREVINPEPINVQKTIFYIDLRHYEWDVRNSAWTQIEQVYPYSVVFDPVTQAGRFEKLTHLQTETGSTVPFVYVDWFLATASLPPLYHDILGLPLTDHELEAQLEVDVLQNILNAPGIRVWRAGFNESGVSRHNRVVERHISRYGAYWKSYDFAGSAASQNIFTHPLDFIHDGGEIVFNLPNGLQAYYLVDASGNRLDEAPISIVSNPAVGDPTVRNGLSCIGCHTEGMKTFEDEVRAVVDHADNPPFDKVRALELYVEKPVMDALVAEDTERYKTALKATGGVFGGIEPIQRLYEAFQGPLSAAHAAAAAGLETETFLEKIRKNTTLQNLLGTLVIENGTVKRDAWTSNFDEVIDALNDSVLPPNVQRPERIPGATVYIPDLNLRRVIAKELGKGESAFASFTAEEMAALIVINAEDEGIKDLRGIEFATNLVHLNVRFNAITDPSPIIGLKKLKELRLRGNVISDFSGLAELGSLKELWISGEGISDFSSLAELTNLEGFGAWGLAIDDISPLTGFTKLRWLELGHNKKDLTDISPLANLTGLKRMVLYSMGVEDISPLANLTGLKNLTIANNKVSDVSPLAGLTQLDFLSLQGNDIWDFSPIAGLLEKIPIWTGSNPGFPTEGPKIEGPWLWVLAPIYEMPPMEAAASGTDFLAQMSKGAVTEQQIATEGAKAGDSVGNGVWTVGKISSSVGNINDMVNATSLEISDTNRHIAYGSIVLGSPRDQTVNMLIGSGDSVKVWLNGALVHNHPTGRGIENYTEFLPVTLRKGANVLLVAVYERREDGKKQGWTGFFGFEDGTEYTVVLPDARFTFAATETTLLAGDTLTLNLNAENISDLAGWQTDIVYDPNILEAVEVAEGDFLKKEGTTTFFQKGTIDNTAGKVTALSSALISESGVSGTGTLLSVTFEAKAGGETQITLANFEFGSITGDIIPSVPPNITITVGGYPPWDVNQDGRVSVLDLIHVARDLGSDAPANLRTDVNRDGVINVQDLILVARHLGESTTSVSPSILAMDGIEGLDPATIQAWIALAQVENDGSIAFQQGIANLQRLLASLLPEETALLPNYPNPFNPETWIPYQLSEPAEVRVTIYTVNGELVRTLALGQLPAGIYQTRSRAAYWDGKNDVGESVASGLYFYTLTAREFTATRKMLIKK